MGRSLEILILLGACLACASQPLADSRLEGVTQFDAAYQAWDGPQFAAAAALFQQATSHFPRSSTNYYWLGTAHFHHLLQLQHSSPERSDTQPAAAAMDAALSALQEAVKMNPLDAESHALLGTLYGMKINGSLVRAVRFGPRVEAHRQKALQLGAANPRVQYLLGTCQFHTAKKKAAFREALATFLTAEQLFETEAKIPAGPLEPRWGYASCLTFIGRTYEQLAERTKAAEYFRKALARHPADHLAEEGLGRVTEKR
ncbi:MAG: tetratricopeptide repeat protein [Verrucomicrobiota bacterium]